MRFLNTLTFLYPKLIRRKISLDETLYPLVECYSFLTPSFSLSASSFLIYLSKYSNPDMTLPCHRHRLRPNYSSRPDVCSPGDSHRPDSAVGGCSDCDGVPGPREDLAPHLPAWLKARAATTVTPTPPVSPLASYFPRKIRLAP